MAEAELEDAEPIEAYIPPRPIVNLPEQTIMMTDADDRPQIIKWEPSDLTEPVLLAGNGGNATDDPPRCDTDEYGPYVELCFDPHAYSQRYY